MADLQSRVNAVTAERAELLKILAFQANSAHSSARGAAGAAMAHILDAGNALARARDLCDLGEWYPWVRANFQGSLRTAQRYIRTARCWPEAANEATRVSRPSQRRAIGAVRGLLFAPPKQNAADALFGTDDTQDCLRAPGLVAPSGVTIPELLALACDRLSAVIRELRASAPVAEEAASAVISRVQALHDALLTEFACDTEGAESWVYIIEAVGVDRVKIGVAIDPERRLQQLQTGSPVPLRLLSRLRGGRAVERGLHARFSAFRLAGEWFHLTKWVRRMIESLCSGDGADNAERGGSQRGL